MLTPYKMHVTWPFVMFFSIHSSWRSRRWSLYWTRPWCFSASCRKRMCLKGTTSSTWPAGCSPTRVFLMTRRKTWSQNSRWAGIPYAKVISSPRFQSRFEMTEKCFACRWRRLSSSPNYFMQFICAHFCSSMSMTLLILKVHTPYMVLLISIYCKNLW